MPDQIAEENVAVTPLDHYRVLAFSGRDRAEFLQGQLTQDIASLETARTALAGWTSAKGRLLAAGQLIATDNEILWPLPVDIIKTVARRLQMFVLRAHVKIVDSTLPVSGLIGVGSIERLQIANETITVDDGPTRFSDGSLFAPVIGDPTRAWLIGPAAETTGLDHVAESLWTLRSIRSGIPFIVAETQELFVPQMVNLDRIGAISFDKGCYVGQEIVARTQNLGRIKRRMYRYSADEVTTLRSGSAIYGPENATGKIVLASEEKGRGEFLAVVPIDTENGPWFADQPCSIELRSLPLPYEPTSAHQD